MDDCNANERAEKAKERACSDSSMDDCNTTMEVVNYENRSDSSMDDCNQAAGFKDAFITGFRFLYGRV